MREGEPAAPWQWPLIALIAPSGRNLSQGGSFLFSHLQDQTSVAPSFVCSVELAETEQADADEFSQFVKVTMDPRHDLVQFYNCD